VDGLGAEANNLFSLTKVSARKIKRSPHKPKAHTEADPGAEQQAKNRKSSLSEFIGQSPV
jgi:hypothetical protein